MPESFTEIPVSVTAESARTVRSSVGCVSPFKYYIHDGIEACRLELLGDLNAAQLSELKGCWRTAKTTLGTRKLILDCKGLTALDDAGRDWVTSMQSEGALCPQHPFSKVVVSKAVGCPTSRQQPRRFEKVLAMLRSLRVPFGPSSTQAQ